MRELLITWAVARAPSDTEALSIAVSEQKLIAHNSHIGKEDGLTAHQNSFHKVSSTLSATFGKRLGRLLRREELRSAGL
jgi:hypothetical protein